MDRPFIGSLRLPKLNDNWLQRGYWRCAYQLDSDRMYNRIIEAMNFRHG